jgi:hypothetical protein
MRFPDGALLSSILASSGSQTTPALPGGIIAWAVCNSRKRSPIGGWLMFYYWQLYSGLIMSAVLFGANLESYIPEYFNSPNRYALFLASAAPGLILLLVEIAVATLLLIARARDMLLLLRWVIVANIVAAIVAGIIDAEYFPDNLVFSFLNIGQHLLWLAYFFRSTRVRHVFFLQDWDIAVNSIYPLKLKVAI